ncbi:MAG: hypothetical protein KUG78_21895 [Kangiellaceae bacterium]|nr:hypothetical protein [Kangiellaceae bacterium]
MSQSLQKSRKASAKKLFTPIHGPPLPLLPHPPIPPAHGLSGGVCCEFILLLRLVMFGEQLSGNWRSGVVAGIPAKAGTMSTSLSGHSQNQAVAQ